VVIGPGTMIDLHLHTTASDGQCAPAELVARARDAGITVLAVTDHDTMDGVSEAAAHAVRLQLGFVPGIEITAVCDGHDVHVLGYWVDGDSSALAALLHALRTARLERAREIVHRLSREGAPIDISELVDGAAAAGRSIARPAIARALIRYGHVGTVSEAFVRFLNEGKPAYVPHRGPSPIEVVCAIVQAGGIASLAHPGPLNRDELIPELVAVGLAAVEAYHSAHDEQTRSRYLAVASEHGLAVTGGSDFHGLDVRRAEFFGRVGLPAADFSHLLERAGRSLERCDGQPM
jgi:3',5'-nucleoside bisphosphate phosphatase